LPAGGAGAADVRADGVVGALELGGAADVVVGLGEPQGRDAEAVEERAERVVAEGVGVPLRHDDDGLFGLGGGLAAGLAAVAFRGGRIPAGVYGVVLGEAGANGRGEAQVGRLVDLAGSGLALPLGVFGQGFGTDVGGIELRVMTLETEVRGGLVAEEVAGVRDDLVVEGDHALERLMS
jgi:hypothetical protein